MTIPIETLMRVALRNTATTALLLVLGQGRGGFYSYDWLENLFGCNIHNADRVLSQYQNLKAGDGIRTHPQMPAIPVVAVEPERVIVLHGRPAWCRIIEWQHEDEAGRLRGYNLGVLCRTGGRPHHAAD